MMVWSEVEQQEQSVHHLYRQQLEALVAAGLTHHHPAAQPFRCSEKADHPSIPSHWYRSHSK